MVSTSIPRVKGAFTTPAPYPKVDGTQACADYDPDQFFPTPKDGDSVGVLAAGAAIAACRRCPFIRACLAYAITHDVDGVWGGTTTRQRRRIQHEQQIRPVPLTGLNHTTEGKDDDQSD